VLIGNGRHYFVRREYFLARATFLRAKKGEDLDKVLHAKGGENSCYEKYEKGVREEWWQCKAEHTQKEQLKRNGGHLKRTLAE